MKDKLNRVQARASTRFSSMCKRAAASPAKAAELLFGWLVGNDQTGDLAVGGGRDDVLGLQLRLVGIRTPIDDFLGVGVTDARKRLELTECGAVDVHKLGCRRLSRGLGGGLGLGDGSRKDSEEDGSCQSHEGGCETICFHAFLLVLSQFELCRMNQRKC